MATVYRIYTNHGTGGPVDYSSPAATATGLSYTSAAVAPSSDTTFVVRAYDTVSGLEESNTEARVRVVVGVDGSEVGPRPNPPQTVTLSPSSGGGCRVTWAYVPAAPAPQPDGFYVSLSDLSFANAPDAVVKVPYVRGLVCFSANLPGPFPPSTYRASVSSYNASGESARSGSSVRALGLPAGPYVMDPVIVQATPRSTG